jgi:hypothetical protein
VKRLVTTIQMPAGQQTTVGDVDLATWGGKGTVRLWIKVTPLDEVAAP